MSNGNIDDEVAAVASQLHNRPQGPDRTRAMSAMFAEMYGGREPWEARPDLADERLTLDAWLRLEDTPPPFVGMTWVRQVTSVADTGSGMSLLPGRYVFRQRDEGDNIRPGTVVIAATPMRITQRQPQVGESSRTRYIHAETGYVQCDLEAFIFMPEQVWYPLPGTAMQQRSGWHERMRDALRTWLAYAPEERIRRVCHAALEELQSLRDLDRSVMSDQEFAGLTTAVGYFQEVLDGITAAVSRFEQVAAIVLVQQAQAHNVRVSDARVSMPVRFEQWVAHQATVFQISTNDVQNLIRSILDAAPATETEAVPVVSSETVENRQPRGIHIRKHR